MIVLEPQGDKIVCVALKESETKIKDFALAQASKERPVISDVIAVGSDVKNIKVGDRVCYTRYAPNEVEIDNATFIILKEEDILAKVKEKKA
jgi:chaperonin GroES